MSPTFGKNTVFYHLVKNAALVFKSNLKGCCLYVETFFYQEVKNAAWHQVQFAGMLPVFGNIWVLCWVAQLCPSWLSFMEQLMFFKGITGISCGNNLYLSWVQLLFLEETTHINCGNSLYFSQEQLIFLMGTTLASCRNHLYFSWEQVIFLMGTLIFYRKYLLLMSCCILWCQAEDSVYGRRNKLPELACLV